MAKDEADKTKALVAEHGKEIYRAAGAPVAGNPDGDITVVEFFDYNCGYCKRGFGDIAKLVETDKNVRVVFKEFPILREESEQASKVALAAKNQGKYWEVHRALISTKGLVNEAVALKAAEGLGLDMVKLKADMASPEVKAELDRVKELAKTLQINGTPHFLRRRPRHRRGSGEPLRPSRRPRDRAAQDRLQLLLTRPGIAGPASGLPPIRPTSPRKAATESVGGPSRTASRGPLRGRFSCLRRRENAHRLIRQHP